MNTHARSRVVILAAALPLLLGVDLLRSRNRSVEEGNARMSAGKAEEALGEYDKAVARLPQEPGAHFNRGAALYALSRWEEAASEFLRATEAKTPSLKASAFYNLGNSFFQAGKFGDAVEAFKKSLAYNPSDVRAKWNLELAHKKKVEEEKKKEQDDKNKDGDKNDKGDQDKKDKQSKNDQKDQKDGKDKQDDDKQGKQDDEQKQGEDQKQQDEKEQAAKDGEKKPQPQPSPGKEDKDKGKAAQAGKDDQKKEPAGDMKAIDAVLDSLEASPKTLEQERARLRAVRRQPPVKDW